MKNILPFFLLFAFSILQAQIVADFEGLVTDPESFVNGQNGTTQFSNGPAEFPIQFDFDYGFWLGGFAASNVTDTVTADFTNLYGVRPAGGSDSETYAIGQQAAIVRILPDLRDNPLISIDVTNTNFAWNVIQDGNSFADPFGGEMGDVPDFFSLNIWGFKDGVATPDTVVFFLADYRFEDNNLDYIVDTWETVDLSVLGAVDSLQFFMESTGMNNYGISTPLFYGIDNLTIDEESSVDSEYNTLPVAVFPNPFKNELQVDLTPFGSVETVVEIFDMQGRRVFYRKEQSGTLLKLSLENLPSGSYVLRVLSDENVATELIQK